MRSSATHTLHATPTCLWLVLHVTFARPLAHACLRRDFLPRLTSTRDVDLLVQREGAPPAVLARTGSGVNSGFVYLRCGKRQALTDFLMDVVHRGLVEFYHRWNHIVLAFFRADPQRARYSS